MDDEILCPFSQPIMGNFCACPHARLLERCSGKMECRRVEEHYSGCLALADLLVRHSRFALGRMNDATELTHAQAMKVRCGGLLGMRRVMGPQSQTPEPVQLIAQAISQYASLDAFPFADIIQDIQGFSPRNKSRP